MQIVQNKIWAGPNETGAYDFPDVMRANYVYDVIYDGTLMNLKYWAQNFQKNTVIFIS